MREFLYKLFKLEYEKDRCESCERLMLLLEDEKRRHDKVLGVLLIPKVEPPQREAPENYVPPKSRYTPWSATQQRLEHADRLRAAELRQQQAVISNKEKIEALEKEAGIPTLEEEVEKANG